jgi:hypothetical protein
VIYSIGHTKKISILDKKRKGKLSKPSIFLKISKNKRRTER